MKMMVTFEKRKSDFLGKIDKSSIGGWDKKIKGLCDWLNKSDDYFTLSSCSGRVVLLKNVVKKKHGLFVYRSHGKIKFVELVKELEKAKKQKGSVLFKQEPAILHVACSDLGSAYLLLRKAQNAGWKHSGIISIAPNRIVCELIGSESLALPIVSKGRVLVDDKFLKILVSESNDRLSRTWDKITKLNKIL